MNIKLEGDIGSQVDQIKILNSKNIDVQMEDSKFNFDIKTDEQGVDLLEIIDENILPVDSNLSLKKDDIKKFLSTNYNDDMNKYAMFQDYHTNVVDGTIEIRNTARKFNLTLLVNHYQFDFFDNGLELNSLHNREILYYIKKDAELYTYFKSLLDELEGKEINDSYDESKKIYLKEDENGIYFIFQKILGKEADNTVLISTDNDAWCSIDKFYNYFIVQEKKR